MLINRRSLLEMMAAGTAFVLIPSAQLLAKTADKRYAMVFDVRRCTGCLSCTVSCAVENKTSAGRSRADVSQVTVTGKSFGSAVLPLPHQCNHCDVPPCVSVCPTKATYKRSEDGIVVIDYNKCIHCQACTQVCPYGARKADPEFKTPPEKCNFCIHRLQEGLLPACVESCIGKARVFGDLNDETSEIYRLIKENKVYALLPNLGTKPNIFYIGLPEGFDDKAMLQTKPIQWQR